MDDITSKNLTELQMLIKNYGESPFRAKQLFEWLHKKMVWDYSQMTNLPKTLKKTLEQDYPILPIKVVKKYTSQLD